MTSILIFLLVLSFLVFFHEMGHFLAAKACNIYVDRFSIGMPPRIIGFKWGETDYCIGALPIGGFVKMAGQEDAPLSEEEREKEYGSVPPERWFNNKPVWQRSIVLLAGPVANLILAVILYGVTAAMGMEVPESSMSPRIGIVEAGYPAESAPMFKLGDDGALPDLSGEPDTVGWKSGDLIVTMNGQPLENIPDLAINALLNGEGTTHDFIIERTGADDSKTRYLSQVAPVRGKEDKYPRFGVGAFSAVLVADVMEDTPAEAAGLLKDDIVRRADGQLIDTESFMKLTQNLPEGQSLDLQVDRGGEELAITLTPKTIGRLRSVTFDVAEKMDDMQGAQPVVAAVEEAYTEKTGLKRKDQLLTINGQPATVGTLQDLEQAVPGGTLNVEVKRPAIWFGLLRRGETLTLDLPVDAIRAIGIQIGTPRVIKHVPASEIVPVAFERSYDALEKTVLTLKALALRDVSPKDLGGPVMIFQVTSNAAKVGLGWLIDITAFISINLFVFNLLPLPVLDGGQLLINGIEGIRRKPVSIAVQERYQQVGLFLVIGLMLFVTWNDVGRIFEELIP